jgi:hypothetical protein
MPPRASVNTGEQTPRLSSRDSPHFTDAFSKPQPVNARLQNTISTYGVFSMTNDHSLMQLGTRNSLLHKFATSRSFTPLSGPIFLTVEEVVERYRGQVSEGTLRNWRSMKIGPAFAKIGKAILYPLEELDRWDLRNLVVCRPSRSLPLEEAAGGG